MSLTSCSFKFGNSSRWNGGSSSSLALPTLELEPKLPFFFFFYTQVNDPDYPVLLRTSRGEVVVSWNNSSAR
jgi:hypothetical protein